MHLDAASRRLLKDLNKLKPSPGIVAELLEIAIHNILYSRKVYPEAAFQKSRKYNIPIQVAVHPQVVDYIDSCVMTMHKLLHRNELRKMVLHIADAAHNPVEQFVFEVSVPVDGAPQSNGSSKMEEDSYLLDVEAAARAICLRVTTSDSVLQDNPEGCSFSIQLHVAESTAMRLSLSDDPDDQSFPWVEADSKDTDIPGGSIIPLKCANVTVGKVHLYVVESDGKGSK
ncbi:mitotic spindle assembly checkpoint protein MAD2B isoform X1 [Ixodes scapularis]|uniref:mitotic spindle assembly checkpoint protein MAD2B isoform X1 n=1 Tax=Ixodes scapularis TaxID=6945 RepID=UPI001A9D2574|nr:mitotic spindle assembly checkpoint protein MAD2B isoform X1 [Ixodes scapularis]